MVRQIEFTLQERGRGCHLVTGEILRHLGELPECGILNLFVKHTSCALTINENADPDVRHDLSESLDRIAPERQPFYRHTLEGDDDMPAHVKSTLCGVSLTVPVTGGKLNLGTWQGIYLCEFRDCSSPRRIVATLYY